MINHLSRILPKIGQCRDKHGKPKAEARSKRSGQPELCGVKFRVLAGSLCPNLPSLRGHQALDEGHPAPVSPRPYVLTSAKAPFPTRTPFPGTRLGCGHTFLGDTALPSKQTPTE